MKTNDAQPAPLLLPAVENSETSFFLVGRGLVISSLVMYQCHPVPPVHQYREVYSRYACSRLAVVGMGSTSQLQVDRTHHVV